MIIKICGIQEIETLVCCENNNVNFFGMIFYDDSERNVIATMELRNSLPTGCRLRVYQVKDGACRLRCSYVGREG